MKSFTRLVAFCAIFLYGCQFDRIDGLEVDPALDEELETALVDNANGNGLNHYKLPNSSDFASIPQDPLNTLTQSKIELGRLLYHETALANKPKVALVGSEGTYSCATCHHVKAGFQAGRRQGLSEGGIGFGVGGEARTLNPVYVGLEDSVDVQPIRTPTALNVAYQKVMLWNGQFGATGMNAGTQASWTYGTPKAVNNLGFEGIETQAIAGFDVHRQAIDNSFFSDHPAYVPLFDKAFPNVPVPDRYDKVRVGLAIAAYERTLLATEAPFQKWLNGDKSAMTNSQKQGAVLFFDKGNCGSCHTGPALNSMSFHALGMNELKGPDTFQTTGLKGERLGRGGFTGDPTDNYKFKTPQLYNMTDSPFLGHGGNFVSVREVVEYKNNAVPQNIDVPSGQLAADFVPLGLTAEEIDLMVDFLENALYDDNLMRHVPANILSGNYFPVNDSAAQDDAGVMGGS